MPNAERILPAIAHLNRFAAAHGIPVVSTTDAHAENDPEFSVWPPHCIAGTWGQHKAQATLVGGASQIIVEKQTVDVFLAPNLVRVVERLDADRYVVYGVVTEICVLYAVRGLLKTGKPVTLVTDAVAALTAEASARALEEVRAGGGTLTTVSEICLRQPLSDVRGSESASEPRPPGSDCRP